MQLAVDHFEIQAFVDNQLDSRSAAIVYGKIMADERSNAIYKKLIAQKELLIEWYKKTVPIH